ncbi:hypothetical protein INR49_008291 [Caranx melampygus]|nr:hypothetical protein INR49_008291 [Caranx melampygus]
MKCTVVFLVLSMGSSWPNWGVCLGLLLKGAFHDSSGGAERNTRMPWKLDKRSIEYNAGSQCLTEAASVKWLAS